MDYYDFRKSYQHLINEFFEVEAFILNPKVEDCDDPRYYQKCRAKLMSFVSSCFATIAVLDDIISDLER